MANNNVNNNVNNDINNIVIADLDRSAMEQAAQRWATRAEPPGALGRLEELAIHFAGITGKCPPAVPTNPKVTVFAADHGVVADGASAWPSEITTAMFHTIAADGAGISAFAKSIGAEVTLVDVGVAVLMGDAFGSAATDFLHTSSGTANIVHRKVRPGTDSITTGPAMSESEALEALNVGIQTANSLMTPNDPTTQAADCLIAGEVGIGNTTTAAAIIAAVTKSSAEAVTGAGAGIPTQGLTHKQALVTQSVERAHWTTATQLLAELGGIEIAALAGYYIAAAQARVPFIVDGVVAAAALCAADLHAPGTARLSIAGHLSAEPGAAVALEHLQLKPLLDLNLRLGEGTGACLAFPLLVAAAEALNSMADLPV